MHCWIVFTLCTYVQQGYAFGHVSLCICVFIYLFTGGLFIYLFIYIYIPLPGCPFDVGGALSMP